MSTENMTYDPSVNTFSITTVGGTTTIFMTGSGSLSSVTVSNNAATPNNCSGGHATFPVTSTDISNLTGWLTSPPTKVQTLLNCDSNHHVTSHSFSAGSGL